LNIGLILLLEEEWVIIYFFNYLLENIGHHSYTDKAQLNDPLFHLLSEVEQPAMMRKTLKKWRSGAEIRFKMPYYPETKKPEATFNY